MKSMLAKLKAIWAAIKYRLLTTKDWLSSYSFSITGLHAAYVAMACLIALGAAYKLGKWDGSAHGLKSLAYGFVMPAADPPHDTADLTQCIASAVAWKAKADELATAKPAVKVAVVAPLPALAPANCVAGKTVVRYYKPHSTTVLQDLGLAK